MQNIIYKSVLVAVTAGVLASCKPKLDAPTPDKGSLDVTRYVAVGNSITAGFADGALYYDGQNVSYATLLANQFKLIGGGDFKIPYVPQSSNGIYPVVNGTSISVQARQILKYATDCKGVTSLSPVRLPSTDNASVFLTSIASQGPFNLMGVPGAKVINVSKTGYGNPLNALSGNYNPYFGRMVSTTGALTASMLSEAEKINPTFFTLFIGNNDILSYATSGGSSTGESITPSAGGINVGFDASYDNIINKLTASGAKGAIATIPNITDIPHFTTVTWNGLTLSAAQANQLNQTTSGIFNFHEGSNAFVIADASVPGINARQIKPNELIVLSVPLDSVKCNYMGSLIPIPDKYVLTETEIANIKNAVDAYNAKIRQVASDKGLALVDLNAFLSTTKSGIVYNGITVNASFVKGGAFSLDGIHLNPIGNALMANEFIKAINATYGSTIPQVDATKYRGVKFP